MSDALSASAPISQPSRVDELTKTQQRLERELELAGPDIQSQLPAMGALKENIIELYELKETTLVEAYDREIGSSGDEDNQRRKIEINEQRAANYQQSQQKLLRLELLLRDLITTKLSQPGAKEGTERQRKYLEEHLEGILDRVGDYQKVMTQEFQMEIDAAEIAKLRRLREGIADDLQNLRSGRDVHPQEEEASLVVFPSSPQRIDGLPTQTPYTPTPGIEGLPEMPQFGLTPKNRTKRLQVKADRLAKMQPAQAPEDSLLDTEQRSMLSDSPPLLYSTKFPRQGPSRFGDPSKPAVHFSEKGLGGWNREEDGSSTRTSEFNLNLESYQRQVDEYNREYRASQFIAAIDKNDPGFHVWLKAAMAEQHSPIEILDFLNEVVRARNTPVAIPERTIGQKIRGYLSRANDEYREEVNMSINTRYSFSSLKFQLNKLRDHTDGVLRVISPTHTYIQPMDRNKSVAPLLNQARRINSTGEPNSTADARYRLRLTAAEPGTPEETPAAINNVNPPHQTWLDRNHPEETAVGGLRGQLKRFDQKRGTKTRKRESTRLDRMRVQADLRPLVKVGVDIGDEVSLVKDVQHRGDEVDVLIKKSTLDALMRRADELEALVAADRPLVPEERESTRESSSMSDAREEPRPSEKKPTRFPWFSLSGLGFSNKKKPPEREEVTETAPLAEADRTHDTELLAEQHGRLTTALRNIQALTTARSVPADTDNTKLLIGENSPFARSLTSISNGLQDPDNRYPESAVNIITSLQTQVQKIRTMTVAGHSVNDWMEGTASIREKTTPEGAKRDLKAVETELHKLTVQVDAARAVIGRKQYEKVDPDPNLPPVPSLTETAYRHFEESEEGPQTSRVEQSALELRYIPMLAAARAPLMRWLGNADKRTNAVELFHDGNWPALKKLGMRDLTTMGGAFNGLDDEKRAGVPLEKMPADVQRSHELWKQLLVLDIGGAELKAWGDDIVFDTQIAAEKWQSKLTDIGDDDLKSLLTACQKKAPPEVMTPDAAAARDELMRIFLAAIPRPRNVAGKTSAANLKVGQDTPLHPKQIAAAFSKQAEANLDRFLASANTSSEAIREQLTANITRASLDADRAASHLKRIFDEVMPEFAKVINRNVTVVGQNTTELDARYYGTPDLDKVERVITQIRSQAHSASNAKGMTFAELPIEEIHSHSPHVVLNFSELQQIFNEADRKKVGQSSTEPASAVASASTTLSGTTIGGVTISEWCSQNLWQKGEFLPECKALLTPPATKLNDMLNEFHQLLDPEMANNPLRGVIQMQAKIDREASKESAPLTLVAALQLALSPDYPLHQKGSTDQQRFEQFRETYQSIAKVFNHRQLTELLEQTAKSPADGMSTVEHTLAATPALEQFAACWQTVFNDALPELRKVSGPVDRSKVEDAVLSIKEAEKNAALSSLDVSEGVSKKITPDNWGGYWDEKRTLMGATEVVPYANDKPGALFKHKGQYIYVTKTQIDNYLGPLGVVTGANTKQKAIQSMKPAWHDKQSQRTNPLSTSKRAGVSGKF